jgi:HK97 family phage prohead protease
MIERRSIAVEVRATGRRLTGYAATFGTPADIAGAFRETIRPGAFRASLAANNDVVALVDHDMSRLLGRTRSGTLRLAEDTKGLSFDIDVPQTTLGNDVLHMASRGDLGGMSFGFRVAPEGERWSEQGRSRELRAVELIEVSIVHAWPAYTGTSVQARNQSKSGFAEQRRRWLATL